MDILRLLTQTATVTHVAATGPPDKYGNPTEVVSVTAYRAHVQQSRQWEQTGIGDVQNEEWNLYLEPDAVIDGNDRVSVDGVEYELIGPPWQTTNPRTRRHGHVEALMRRTA